MDIILIRRKVLSVHLRQARMEELWKIQELQRHQFPLALPLTDHRQKLTKIMMNGSHFLKTTM